MQRSESASAPDSQSTDADQSSTTSGYFSEMECQLDDSDESMELELSTPCEASSSSQNNSSVLTEKERSRSQTNWQYEYFRAGPDVASVKSISPFRQKSNATQGRSAATLIASKWNATRIGSRSTYEEQLKSNRRTLITQPNGRPQAKMQLHYSQAVPSLAGVETMYGNNTGCGDQFASTTGNYSQSIDSDKSFDELFTGPFDSASLARKLLTKAGKDRRVESERRMAMVNSKMRSKWPMYQTRYSPEVLTETAVNSADLFALSTSPWYERGYQMSLITPVDALQPSSNELNETGDGVSRQYTTLTSSRELEAATIQSDEMTKLNGDPASSPNESKPGDSFDSLSLARKLLKNAGKDKPLDIKRSILITNPNVWSNRPLFQTRYSPEVLSETVVKSTEQHPLVTAKLRSSIESKPTPSVNESAEIEITKLPQTTAPIDQQTPTQSSKFIDPTADIGNVLIEDKIIAPPKSPQHLDDSISVPATPHSGALNEIIISESAPSEYCNDKPIGEENLATPHVSPEPFIQPTNIGNVSIEDNKISPPESPQSFVDSMKLPVTSQSDLLNDPALWDHSYNKLFEELATPPVSPTEFNFSSNSSNVPIEQPTIWPAQSSEDNGLSVVSTPAGLLAVSTPAGLLAVSTPAGLSDISTPTASQSDVNEILISVPPDPSVEVTLPPAASAMSPGIMPSLKQPNAVQMPNRLQPTASRPNSSVKGQKRSYKRKNKIHIQSNELIGLTLPVGSIIQTPSNAAVRINPDQMIFDQKTSNIQMAPKLSLKLQVTNEVKPNQINPAKRKKMETQQRFKSSMANETGANSTTTGVVKRTYTEHLPPHVPAKVQKVQKPAQATMKNISTSSTSAKSVNIATPRTKSQDVKNCAAVAGVSRDGQNSGDRSFADCVLFLQRNNVSVFKVPQNPSQVPPKPAQVPPPNWDKYMKLLQQNNVSVERLNKNISRN